jgi:hypothetical protein
VAVIVPTALFTLAQLQIACGGNDKFLSLVDKQNTQNINDPTCQAFVTEIISIACSKIYSVAQIAADVTDPNIVTPFLIQCAIGAGVYWTWHKSTGGIAVPEEIKSAYRDTIAEVKEYAEGLRAVGSTPTPNTSAGLENINPDPNGVSITRSTLDTAGFT